jgi:hypothetical protein
MSNKSKKHTKGAFGGLRAKRKKLQARYLKNKQLLEVKEKQ